MGDGDLGLFWGGNGAKIDRILLGWDFNIFPICFDHGPFDSPHRRCWHYELGELRRGFKGDTPRACHFCWNESVVGRGRYLQRCGPRRSLFSGRKLTDTAVMLQYVRHDGDAGRRGGQSFRFVYRDPQH